MKKQNMAGPRIFFLDADRAGTLAGWGGWLERARLLGCDWLWLGGIQARAEGAHPFAVADPGRLSLALSGEPGLSSFVAAAHESGLKLATDFAPAFVARESAWAAKHPDWFVAGPDGRPAVPRGLGDDDLTATLAICDFNGPARAALVRHWGEAAEKLLGCGFDALICRAAQRLPPDVWMEVLAAARRKRTAPVVWAETLGAPIEVTEALAPARFDAFFSSASWWNFHAGWFLEQEERLRRMAPTIALAAPPGEPVTADEAVFRYGFAASAAWGVALEIGTRDSGLGTGNGLRPGAAPATQLITDIAGISALKRETSGLDQPGRLQRLSAADARAVVLAVRPMDETIPPVLVTVNPDPVVAAEVECGPLFAALDARVAAARELTPGRSPQTLDAASRVALEPLSIRWFELEAAPLSGAIPEPLPPGEREADNRLLPSELSPIAIERITPRLEDGRFPVKRVLGETLRIEADLVVEGHGELAAELRCRPAGGTWRVMTFRLFDNDRWRGEFAPDRIGDWEYRIAAWRARYAGWRADTIKRRDAGQTLESELGEGEALFREALEAAAGTKDEAEFAVLGKRLAAYGDDVTARAELLLSETTAGLVAAHLAREGLSESPVCPLRVERGRALASAWYECFPRSLGMNGRHGTFGDLIRHLPYIAGLGFDVLYLPPIHPIGLMHRKGKNNALDAGADDPGSPWAIGSPEGGHTAIHPQLGTLADFRRLVTDAREAGLEIALDFAIQCSRDHPWIAEHPEWFRWRPDGTIRYAENPPKKYQDIVNVDFYCADRDALWRALLDVMLFWCGEGVRIFRVDNPHTKPLPFWEWALGEVRARYPDTIFLAEAFTRPKLMYRLAKLGFSQSYTYFTWRETKRGLTEYLRELASDPLAQFFRPNFWVNTPDINPFYLHDGARAAFVIRAVLAATLAPSWGLYSGYELCEHAPLLNEDGTAREEYLDAEKYELKPRDFDAPGNIRAEIAILNRIRRENPALMKLVNLRFHAVANEQILFYSKAVADNRIWVIVSLDPHAAREADIELPLETLDANEDTPLAVTDLFHGGERWEWRGRRQWVRLTPERPAMILQVVRG